MLDGRIDEQGVISELREKGILDYIVRDAATRLEEEEKQEELQEPTADEAAAKIAKAEGKKDDATPRKLVKDEMRQEGAVKWTVYKSYLKASCVFYSSISLSLITSTSGLIGLGDFYYYSSSPRRF